MSEEEYYDDEEVEYEEEDAEEEAGEAETGEDHGQLEKKSLRSEVSREEGETNFLKARQEAKKGELDEQLKEYINDWRKQRAKEEEELKKLKEQQAARKEIRAEQEKKLAQQKKEEEDRFRKEEADKKAKEAEEKRKRLEEAEKKRQSMMQAQKDKQAAAGHVTSHDGPSRSGASMASVQDARREMSKTKEQLEEDKKISMSIRIKHLDVDNLGQEELLAKANDLWETIIRLETEKYDLEERRHRQDYDIRALKERQRQQLRHKAMKKGLDSEALTGKYPPKIRMYSKYERRTDTRTYEDRKKLYEGGWEVLYSEGMEKDWKEKREDWAKRYRAKLPKWFGERPGKKTADPETPEDEEEQVGEPPAEAEEGDGDPANEVEEVEEEDEEEGEEEEEEEEEE